MAFPNPPRLVGPGRRGDPPRCGSAATSSPVGDARWAPGPRGIYRSQGDHRAAV